MIEWGGHGYLRTFGLYLPCTELADLFVHLRGAFLCVGEDDWKGRHALE